MPGSAAEAVPAATPQRSASSSSPLLHRPQEGRSQRIARADGAHHIHRRRDHFRQLMPKCGHDAAAAQEKESPPARPCAASGCTAFR